MTEDELKELLDDIEAAGSNQSGSLEWGTGGFDRAARQGRDLKAQALAAYREQRAEIERQLAQLQQAREALEAIEEWAQWDADDQFYRCLWCKQPMGNHMPDCQRQAALAALEVKP